MKHKRFARTIFVLGTFFCLLGSVAIAQESAVSNDDPKFLASYHVEYGQKLLHDQKYDQAVERFIKAVLLDSENHKAIEALKLISQTPGEISASNSLKVQRILDHIDYIQFLTARYREVMTDNFRLREFVKKNIGPNSAQLKTVLDLDEKAQQRIGVLPRPIELELPLDDHKAALELVLDNLSDKRRVLAKEIDFWEAQNNDWRNIKKNLLEDRSTGLVSTLSEKYKSKLSKVQDELKDRDSVIENQRKNLAYFQAELGTVRQNFEVLEDRFKETDQKIASLTKQIAEMSMEIFEKNRMITDKDNRLENISQELDETREKVNLVQRIIEEKDERIATLEKELNLVQKTASSNLNEAQGVGVTQLKSDFNDFQAQFKAEMDKSHRKIIELETQLSDLNGEYKMLSSQIKEKNIIIENLSGQAEVTALKLSRYQQALANSRATLSQTSAITELYRDRLIETQKRLREKNDEIQRLQQSIEQSKAGIPTFESKQSEYKSVVPDERGLDLTFLKN